MHKCVPTKNKNKIVRGEEESPPLSSDHSSTNFWGVFVFFCCKYCLILSESFLSCDRLWEGISRNTSIISSLVRGLETFAPFVACHSCLNLPPRKSFILGPVYQAEELLRRVGFHRKGGTKEGTMMSMLMMVKGAIHIGRLHREGIAQKQT